MTKKSKISRRWLKKQMWEERKSSLMYKEMSKLGMTKGERAQFKAMAKDELRHARYLKQMLGRR